MSLIEQDSLPICFQFVIFVKGVDITGNKSSALPQC
jgi:hypothetical protein